MADTRIKTSQLPRPVEKAPAAEYKWSLKSAETDARSAKFRRVGGSMTTKTGKAKGTRPPRSFLSAETVWAEKKDNNNKVTGPNVLYLAYIPFQAWQDLAPEFYTNDMRDGSLPIFLTGTAQSIEKALVDNGLAVNDDVAGKLLGSYYIGQDNYVDENGNLIPEVQDLVELAQASAEKESKAAEPDNERVYAFIEASKFLSKPGGSTTNLARIVFVDVNGNDIGSPVGKPLARAPSNLVADRLAELIQEDKLKGIDISAGRVIDISGMGDKRLWSVRLTDKPKGTTKTRVPVNVAFDFTSGGVTTHIPAGLIWTKTPASIEAFANEIASARGVYSKVSEGDVRAAQNAAVAQLRELEKTRKQHKAKVVPRLEQVSVNRSVTSGGAAAKPESAEGERITQGAERETVAPPQRGSAAGSGQGTPTRSRSTSRERTTAAAAPATEAAPQTQTRTGRTFTRR